MDLGCRVVRGADWEWGDQDGGEGCVGVVVDGDTTVEGTVWVQWEGGRLANYRAGFDGKMDLKIYDSSSKGVLHPNVMCDECRQGPLEGMRWKCQDCADYDLCTSCYMADTHDLDHAFTRTDEPQDKSTSVGKREGEKKVTAKGMFSGARVIRGPDWKWGDQDGGKGGEGTVLSFSDWDGKGKKAGVAVRWDRKHKTNIYRNGGNGMVDLIVIKPESGGFFYSNHLPGLVARPKKTVSGFSTGDKVRIVVSKEELIKMAEGHGGWNADMEKCISKVGVIYDFTSSGDAIVSYHGMKWRLTTSAITKIEKFKKGDKVLVSSDIKFVKDMQDGHGGWNERMKSILGMIGTIASTREDDVILSVENNVWLVNPAILTLHESAKADSDSDEEISIDLSSDPLAQLLQPHLAFQKLLADMFKGESDDSSDDQVDDKQGKALVQAASNGHFSHAKQILTSRPELVNYKHKGKTSLHLTCHSGYCDITKLLLEIPNCDTSIKDTQGYVAIHHAAYGDKSGEAITLMLAHGVDPNTADNENKCAPLHLAVKENNVNAVRVLVQHEKCDINVQDAAGDTPLHDAIQLRSNAIVDLILDAPRLLNLTLENKKGFNCLQVSAIKGNAYAIRKILSKSPELVNTAKEDGFTSLHLAAINDHCEIAEALLECTECKVDSLTKNYQTPLMLAVHEGYLTMVQMLIKKGADINATDDDGDTPLHISLARERVCSSGMGLVLNMMGSPSSFSEISRLLISHGANVRKANKIGRTAMDFGEGTKVLEELKEAYEKTKGEDDRELVEDKGPIKTVNTFEAKTEESMETDEQDEHQQNASTNNIEMNNGDTTERTDNNLQTIEEFQNDVADEQPAVPITNDSDNLCTICDDAEADVVFEPCGHCIMCKECSTRAKRCPECKAQVVSKKTKDGVKISNGDKSTMQEKLNAMEKKLQKLEESVTCCVCMSRKMNMVFSCGHGACQVCTEKLQVCAICKKDIERKIAMF